MSKNLLMNVAIDSTTMIVREICGRIGFGRISSIGHPWVNPPFTIAKKDPSTIKFPFVVSSRIQVLCEVVDFMNTVGLVLWHLLVL